MEIDIPGSPCRFSELGPGDCFAFKFRQSVVVCLKLDTPANTSRIAILAHANPKEPPALIRQPPDSAMVCNKLDATIVCEWSAPDIRDGVGAPKSGQVISTATKKLLCVVDPTSDNDPILINLQNGAREGYRAEGPATVFSKWSLALRRGKEIQTIHSFEAAESS